MLIAIMCVRNEEYHLPTFLDHIRDYVDGFVALDDGSTDDTIKILENEPKMLKIIKNKVTNKLDWDEAENRKKLIKETYKVSKDKNNTWVICCDPDERFEKRFLKKMKSYCNPDTKKVYGVHFREIHNKYNTYRCDGLWDKKEKYILFPLKKNMKFDKVYTYRHHIHWFYDDLIGCQEMTKYNLYHLKMLKVEERKKRAELYNKLDPDKKIQPIGYDYLFDNEGMKLKRIGLLSKYDYSLIPEDLKTYKAK